MVSRTFAVIVNNEKPHENIKASVFDLILTLSKYIK